MRTTATTAAFLITLALASAPSLAQLTHRSSVIDGAGGRCSNATYRCVSAVAQPSPAGFNHNADTLNYSGFLQTFVLRPDLDTDGDAIADESDPDNDNDSLWDLTELAGTAFDPATVTDTQVADADADGADDGQEAGMMTNPHDPGSILEVTAIQAGGNFVLTWTARGGRQYQVEYRDDLRGGIWQPFGALVTAAGGTAPWYETTASLTVAMPAAGKQFYRARLITS